MKIVAFSDTHNSYCDLKIPEGDIGIFVGDGDFRFDGNAIDFISWYKKQPLEHKIVIAGNHDKFVCENESLFKKMCEDQGLIYLNDSMAEIKGIKIWGSAYTIDFCNWYFMEGREDLKRHWDLIPKVDIVATHQPPYGIGDFAHYGQQHTGCKYLREILLNRVKPKYHFFGHIHEGHGSKEIGGVKFYNVSVMNLAYDLIHPATVVDI